MDEEPNVGPKITTAEIIFVGGFFAIIDLIDIFGLIFALPLSTLTSILAWPASQLYAYLRGLRQDMLLVSNILEFIPYVGSLPMRTVAYGIVAYAANHPKLRETLAVAEKAAGKAPPVRPPAAKPKAPQPVPEKPAPPEAAAEESAAEIAERKAREATEVFGGEAITPTERVRVELLGERPLTEEAPRPERRETPFAEPTPEKKEGVLELERREAPTAEPTPEKEEEIAGTRLGGAYAEEEKIKRGMEEVEIEGNAVNLREGSATRAADRFRTPENKIEEKKAA